MKDLTDSTEMRRGMRSRHSEQPPRDRKVESSNVEFAGSDHFDFGGAIGERVFKNPLANAGLAKIVKAEVEGMPLHVSAGFRVIFYLLLARFHPLQDGVFMLLPIYPAVLFLNVLLDAAFTRHLIHRPLDQEFQGPGWQVPPTIAAREKRGESNKVRRPMTALGTERQASRFILAMAYKRPRPDLDLDRMSNTFRRWNNVIQASQLPRHPLNAGPSLMTLSMLILVAARTVEMLLDSMIGYFLMVTLALMNHKPASITHMVPFGPPVMPNPPTFHSFHNAQIGRPVLYCL